MTKLKILVMCPGQFTYALNSPERGESRWSQNYARMLSLAGHNVFAASMGRPEPRISEGVNLIHETEVERFGPYDIYIDSAWWNNKEPKGKAKKYIILKWSLEDYTREFNFPDNYYLGYPYPSHMHEFAYKEFKGKNKTFALPTMFGLDFPKPNWEKQKVFLPGKIDTNRDYKKYIPAIVEFLNKYPVEGASKTFFQEEFKELKLQPGSNLYELKPYNEVMDSMGNSKLSLPILNPGCIIEAAFMGTPSIFWEHGGFYNPLAKSMNVLIPHGGNPEVFIEISNEMMRNKKRHWEVTRMTQDYFSYHLYKNAIEYFNAMIEEIL